MKWIIYELRIWNQVKLWSSQLWEQFLQLRREAWKIQDFNGVWTRDLAIPVRRSNQLSYEATDVGSWSFVGSNGPVRNESMMKWYMKCIMYELRIWNQVKLWSSQLWEQFLQLRRKPEKFRTSTWFEPVTSRFRCDALMVPWGNPQASLRNCIASLDIFSVGFVIVFITYEAKLLNAD